MHLAHFYSEIPSPFGIVSLCGTERGLTGVFMEAHRHRPSDQTRLGWQGADERFEAPRAQLAEYFAGERQTFDLPIDREAVGGTPFQRRVWEELERVRYGTTVSYGELAGRLGQPAAVRAVGLANGRNPLSIIVPCHRVVGANGSLTGYGGGIDRKRWLLDLEGGALRLDLPGT